VGGLLAAAFDVPLTLHLSLAMVCRLRARTIPWICLWKVLAKFRLGRLRRNERLGGF